MCSLPFYCLMSVNSSSDQSRLTNPCPTLFQIVPCHKLDVHAGLLCQDFLVSLNL